LSGAVCAASGRHQASITIIVLNKTNESFRI